MNQQKTAIIVDSGCDIPKDELEKYDITVVPLRVIYPEKDYRDGIDIEATTIYERFPDEFPTTSTPSIDEIMKVYEEKQKEGYENLIVICISSKMSGTYNAARLAAEEYDDLNVFVFDTKNLSYGSGFFAIWAANKLKEGMKFIDLTQELSKKIENSAFYFYLDTLKYLQRGGRIGSVASFLGDALKLKPVITVDENGVLKTVAKMRGNKFGKQKLIDEVARFAGDDNIWIAVKNGGNEEEGIMLKHILRSKFPNAKIRNAGQVAPSLAIHTGPGALGVAVFKVSEKN